jgi:ketosteroid isomerase-like protein
VVLSRGSIERGGLEELAQPRGSVVLVPGPGRDGEQGLLSLIDAGPKSTRSCPWEGGRAFQAGDSDPRLPAPVGLRDTGRVMSEGSTTPDLVELVRKQVEALNRRDFDGVMSSVAEDGVLDGRADFLEGRATIRGFLDDWFGAYEELEYELEEVNLLAGGVVFAVVIQDGRLVGSAGRIRQREGWVYLWVGGSIARLTTSEVDEARAAAERLSEERG